MKYACGGYWRRTAPQKLGRLSRGVFTVVRTWSVAAGLSPRRVGSNSLTRPDLDFHLDVRAPPYTPGGAGEIAEAVHRHDHRLIERRHMEGRRQMRHVVFDLVHLATEGLARERGCQVLCDASTFVLVTNAVEHHAQVGALGQRSQGQAEARQPEVRDRKSGTASEARPKVRDSQRSQAKPGTAIFKPAEARDRRSQGQPAGEARDQAKPGTASRSQAKPGTASEA